MKRRKAKAERKEDQIRVRLTAEQKALIEGTARAVGMEPSTWLRHLALREVNNHG